MKKKFDAVVLFDSGMGQIDTALYRPDKPQAVASRMTVVGTVLGIADADGVEVRIGAATAALSMKKEGLRMVVTPPRNARHTPSVEVTTGKNGEIIITIKEKS